MSFLPKSINASWVKLLFGKTKYFIFSNLRIPSPLRRFTNGESSIVVHGGNIREVLEELFSAHPDIKGHLVEDDGSLRNFVNIFIEGSLPRDIIVTKGHRRYLDISPDGVPVSTGVYFFQKDYYLEISY